MLKKTRSILEELDSHFIEKDKENVLESRADHVIQGAINLINSIRAQDPNKFIRGIRRMRSESATFNKQ